MMCMICTCFARWDLHDLHIIHNISISAKKYLDYLNLNHDLSGMFNRCNVMIYPLASYEVCLCKICTFVSRHAVLGLPRVFSRTFGCGASKGTVGRRCVATHVWIAAELRDGALS